MDVLTRFLMDLLVKPEDDEREARPKDDEGVGWFYFENTIAQVHCGFSSRVSLTLSFEKKVIRGVHLENETLAFPEKAGEALLFEE